MQRNLTLLIILALTVQSLFAQKVNLVKNGTFEMGRTGFKTDYKLQDGFTNPGEYNVTNNVTTNPYPASFKNPLPSTGQFLYIDAFNYPRSAKRCWYDSVSVQPNTTYIFSCSVASVIQLSPPKLKFNVNGGSVSPIFYVSGSNYWQTISTRYTTKSDQTRIEISIVDVKKASMYGNDFAIDNIVFRPEKEIPPVKKEEPVAVITPPVKKEEAVTEVPPVKEEKPITVILPKMESSVIVQSKPNASVIIPPKPKSRIVVPPEPKPPVVAPRIQKLPEAVPPKPKPSLVIQPKEKPLVVVASKPKPPVAISVKPVKKDTSMQIADFKKGISIEQIKLDQKLQLSHIYFERSKYILLETSLPELNDLSAFMKKYPTVRIRLEGHTDNQGNAKLNTELSENRVKEVKKYLVEQGIEDNRIEWIGYGGQRPANSNDDEKLRQKNRRVEVVIIGK